MTKKNVRFFLHMNLGCYSILHKLHPQIKMRDCRATYARPVISV